MTHSMEKLSMNSRYSDLLNEFSEASYRGLPTSDPLCVMSWKP